MVSEKLGLATLSAMLSIELRILYICSGQCWSQCCSRCCAYVLMCPEHSDCTEC